MLFHSGPEGIAGKQFTYSIKNKSTGQDFHRLGSFEILTAVLFKIYFFPSPSIIIDLPT
jgi:hypothetical protein